MLPDCSQGEAAWGGAMKDTARATGQRDSRPGTKKRLKPWLPPELVRYGTFAEITANNFDSGADFRDESSV